VSHAGFLRDHTDGDSEPGVIALIRALQAAGEEAVLHPVVAGVGLIHEALDALPEAAMAILEPQDVAILHFTAEAALAPRQMQRARVEYLRGFGFSDDEIHDIVQVVCCFSYMNRLADSLGVGIIAADKLAWAERLFGAEAIAEHVAWAAPD
jgi:alkylhydroperoxidase family enzyme